MPTYQYRCSQCGSELEAVQKFTDPALTQCPQCEGELRKVYGNVGVVFKGSGFYATDSRQAKKTPAATTAESGSSTKAESSASSTSKADSGSSASSSSTTSTTSASSSSESAA